MISDKIYIYKNLNFSLQAREDGFIEEMLREGTINTFRGDCAFFRGGTHGGSPGVEPK